MCLLTIGLACLPLVPGVSVEGNHIILFHALRLPWLVALLTTIFFYRHRLRSVSLLPLTVFIVYPDTLFYTVLNLTWGILGYSP